MNKTVIQGWWRLCMKMMNDLEAIKSSSAKISTRRGNSQKMTWPQTQPE